MIVILALVLTTYISMIFSTRYRTPIAVLGSGVLLIYGSVTNTFPFTKIFEKFPYEIIILIIVLALFARIFEDNKIFDYIGHSFINITKGNKVLVVILMPFTIYAASLFMNNLSVVLIFTSICLGLSLKLNLPTTPLLVSSIIASNIGGAPLPWADTPAVIITLYTDFNLIDFLNKLFLPCLVYIILLAGYTLLWFKYSNKNTQIDESYTDESHTNEVVNNIEEDKQNKLDKLQSNDKEHIHDKPPHHKKEHIHDKPHNKPPHNRNKNTHDKPNNLFRYKYYRWDDYNSPKRVKLSIILFILFITSVCVGPFLNISIAFVSMFFGAILLITNTTKPEDIINTIPILDSIIFISTLFLIGGVLEYAGILKVAVDYILEFTNGNSFLIVLCIMLSAFIIATFLSAGPAAATLMPICLQVSPAVGDRLVYAALALGILAGSSMLPWSATGGPIMLSEVNRFLKKSDIKSEKKSSIKDIFNLRSYIAFSFPFSFLMVILSVIYFYIKVG
jgi:Na+/H+ antiporter NhaD/arsenite permease-like protein